MTDGELQKRIREISYPRRKERNEKNYDITSDIVRELSMVVAMGVIEEAKKTFPKELMEALACKESLEWFEMWFGE